MTTMRRCLVLAAAALLASASSALACPSCADLGNASAKWYANTTVLLTLLPLVGIVSVVVWIRRQVKLADRP